MVSIDILKNKNVFFGLSDEQLLKVAEVAVHRAFEKGTVIFREGDPGDSLLIIESGAVSIYQKRNEGDGGGVKLATLTTGAVMGEVTLVHIEPRSATAIAIEEETEVVTLRNRDLSNLFRSDRELFIVVLLNLTRVLSKRLRAMDQKLSHCEE